MTRDFTVATFVVWRSHVLLLFHRQLRLWLPPGGHIEPNELPDAAARREVREETGLDVELIGTAGLDPPIGRQLVRPEGIQVESISPCHEHIDLIYFARPRGQPDPHMPDTAEVERIGWYRPEEIARLDAPEDVARWAERAVATSVGSA